MTTTGSPTKACHNCRRQRRKCDRTLPSCLKCTQRGQECLGYDRLFRWDQGLASRGKMRGATFESLSTPAKQSHTQASHRLWSLRDPLMQDLDEASRHSLSYFASNVCQDLIVYDMPSGNPFRALIPLTQCYPSLLHIIVATSALHMHNVSENPLAICLTSMHLSPSFHESASITSQPNLYSIALAAKQRALRSLNSALGSMTMGDLDAILAIVLLFVQYELLDVQQTDWNPHIRGARALIGTMYESRGTLDVEQSTLRRFLISTCLVYDILGSTFMDREHYTMGDMVLNGASSLLHDAEGNHCSSFPTDLLQLLRAGANLVATPAVSDDVASAVNKKNQILLLLLSAERFDPYAWAANIQAQSPASDLQLRTHIASAHRAATYIYLSRLLMPDETSFQVSEDLRYLVAEIQSQISAVSPKDPLFAASAWPAFVAGAEASDAASQEWAENHFCKLWEVQPWGLVKGALGVLRMVWQMKSRGSGCEDDGSSNTSKKVDWVTYLRKQGVDWLVL